MIKPKYDSTVARIAGNIIGHIAFCHGRSVITEASVRAAVEAARAIVAETKRTEPAESPGGGTGD